VPRSPPIPRISLHELPDGCRRFRDSTLSDSKRSRRLEIQLYRPLRALATAGRVMEAWANLTGNTPPAPYKTSMYASQQIWVDPSKAIEELGLPQTPIETAIEDAVKWYRENGYV
jgi:hypothetical protein